MSKPKIILTVEEARKDREKWLQVRSQGIGGSDAGVIMGLNAYRSKLSLWLEKTGKAEPDDLSDNERVYWGIKNEGNIADYFCEKTGKKVRRCGTMQSGEYPWLLANVDRLVEGEQAGLEIKTAGVSQYSLWKGDEIPDSYYAQCQHYMLVTGYEKWYIAVLIGGNEGIIKEVPRNEEFIEQLFHAEAAFWTLVENGIMPEVDGEEDTGKALSKMYPQAKEESVLQVPSTDELEKVFEDYDYYNKTIDNLTKLKTECVNKIKAVMGDNEVFIVGDGDTLLHKVTWKNTSGRTTIDATKLKKECPKIYEKYKKVSAPSRRFEIKEKESKEE